MSKDRISAFMDAVLAIIMTILILELERPRQLTLEGFWDLRMNFLAYTVSFFWLGSMWINIHNEWQLVDKIGKRTVWWVMLLLFASSFFPYVTAVVSSDFNSSIAQVVYGCIVLFITFTNMGMYTSVVKDNTNHGELAKRVASRQNWIKYDIALKVLGLLLSSTIFPPAMLISVLVTLSFLVIPRQLKEE